MISADEARAINPAIHDDAIVGGTFCPTDGFIRAMQITRGYADAAARLGVKFEFGVDVHALRDISADTIVNATGAWASTLGIDIPVAPLKRQVAATIETNILPTSMPMTVWVDDGFHLRVRDGRVLLLWPDAPPNGFDITFNDAWLEPVQRFTRERVPVLRDVPLDREQCWAGLYEMTPDKHPIVGRMGNIVFANGFCGHGVMHAPAIGQLVAELITEGKTSIDITALRLSRFAEGQPNVASSLL
jgi:sarcosine oxidase subunit beta